MQGFSLGGVDYITKPFNAKEVLVRIRTQLQLRLKTKKLEETQGELKRSNEDLQTLKTAISHDLKAPLRNILRLGKFLQEDYEEKLDAEGKDYINKIGSTANRLHQMIESLLVFSRIAKNPQPFELVSLKIVIQRVIDNLQVPIDETKGTIHIGEIVDLNGEPSLLLQLFQNLIANTLKFHKKDEPPVINIRSQVNENQFCEIIVEDNGIGFDEKFADKIFIPLKRLVSNDEYEGSGIGLSTCKKNVDFHKGTITVHSQPDKGTKFTISLPMK